MANFYRNFHDEELDWLDEENPLKKKIKQEEKLPRFFFEKRFYKPSYVNQLNAASFTPEVVIKIFRGGMGQKGANYLMGYIARNLEKYKPEEALSLFNQDGIEIETVEERVRYAQNIAKHFDSYKGLKNAQLFAEEDEVTFQELQNKEHDGELTKSEQKLMDKLNKCSFLLSKYERLEDLKEKQKEVGFLTASEYAEKETYEAELKTVGLDKIKDMARVNHHNLKTDFTHMIFSHGGDDLNSRRAKEAMAGFLAEEFKDRGYEFVWAMHNDTDHCHFHVLLFNKNRLTKERAKFTKEDLYIMRQRFVHHSNAVGLKRVATYKQDRGERLEKYLSTVENLKERRSQYQYKLAKGEEQAFDAFDYKKRIIGQVDRALQTSGYLKQGAKLGEASQLKNGEKVLKELRKSLVMASPRELEKEVDTTVKALAKEDTRLVMTLKDIKYPHKKAKALPETVKKAKIQSVDELRRKHLERVREATRVVRLMWSKATTDEEKEKYGKHLDSLNLARNSTMQSLEQKVSKGKRKGKGLGISM